MRLAVIMAGGSGERFWPLSRRLRPKQLLRLTDPDQTMLEEAVERIGPLVGRENVFIATAGHLAKPIRQAGIVAPENVLAEPDKRNTLGCLAWVAASLLARYGEEGRNTTLTILTADHTIKNPDKFRDDISVAMDLAESTNGLVTLGINPDRPETGYGYIEATDEINSKTYRVGAFREKPDLATAQQFLDAGNFFWNSGMFVWKLSAFCDQLLETNPESHRLTMEMAGSLLKAHTDAAAEFFRELPNLSIDYALMEKSKNVYVVKAEFPWDDVGAFDALLRTMPTDENNNMIFGNVTAIDTQNCILYNDSEGTVMTAVGLRDSILVQTEDAVMCAPVKDAQRVKEIVQKLTGSEYL